MGKVKDLTNQKFGLLTPLYPTEKRIQRKVVWKCKCDCGKEVEVLSTNLTSNRTTSCGCKRNNFLKEYYAIRMPKENEIINNTKILKSEFRMSNRGWNESWSLCLCQFCNTEFWAKTTLIKVGNIRSCGCARRSIGEKTIEKILIDNNIQFEKEKIFPNCYFSKTFAKCRFDFYINNKYIIEFDGPQHYLNTKENLNSNRFLKEDIMLIQERDEYKNQYCKEHNIPIIRIPYWHLDDLAINDLLLETSNFIL